MYGVDELRVTAVYGNIKSRRSVRDYEDKPLEEYKLAQILNAGDLAPSAGNLKSREFIVIDNKEDIDFTLRYIFSKRITEHKKRFKNVPVLVLMCANQEKCKTKYRRGNLYSIQDTALAGQNMMLMATALGVGSCWIGQIREKRLKDRFKINDTLKIIAILALGYEKMRG